MGRVTAYLELDVKRVESKFPHPPYIHVHAFFLAREFGIVNKIV